MASATMTAYLSSAGGWTYQGQCDHQPPSRGSQPKFGRAILVDVASGFSPFAANLECAPSKSVDPDAPADAARANVSGQEQSQPPLHVGVAAFVPVLEQVAPVAVALMVAAVLLRSGRRGS